MLRVVLESSTTPESPDNKNNHFKVRFPAPLQLENGTWEIAFRSITFPNPHDRDTSGLHNDDVTWPFQFTTTRRQSSITMGRLYPESRSPYRNQWHSFNDNLKTSYR